MNEQSFEPRGGFRITLKEFLAVLVIAGIVIGVVMPAIQKARSQGEFQQCQNNLKYIALALHQFHSHHEYLPPGVVVSSKLPAGDPPSIGHVMDVTPAMGVLPFLLPFVEQQSVFDQIPGNFLGANSRVPAWAYASSKADSSTANSSTNTAIPAWALTRIKYFECPAANNEAPFNPAVATCSGVVDAYFASPFEEGPTWSHRTDRPAPGTAKPSRIFLDVLPPTSPGFDGPNVAQMGCTNYVANGGTLGKCGSEETLQSFLIHYFSDSPRGAAIPIGPTCPYTESTNIPTVRLAHYAGPFGVNTGTRVQDITDGTSNTVAFGETLGGQQFADGSVDYRIAWAAGATYTGLVGAQERSTLGAYNSNHSGVANFAFCDGSARPFIKQKAFIFDDLPKLWSVFQSAVGMADGDTPDYSTVCQ
jgi:prepilin-type processing-associated H-X9-DG protein